MSDVSLSRQILKLCTNLKEETLKLASDDPVKIWFQLELQSIEEQQANCLVSANAVFRAVKQLQQLLFEHCVRLRTPPEPEAAQLLDESFLSMHARLPSNVLDFAQTNKFSIEPSLLFNPDWNNDDFDPVSPTAKVVGYLRSLDKSLQVAANLHFEEEGRRILERSNDHEDSTIAMMAWLFQCRYHAMNAAIASTSAQQIMELASGVSPRGLQWAQTMPGTIYVESDLPRLMIHKAKLLRNFLLSTTSENLGILHCCGADVLDPVNLSEAGACFDDQQPVTIVSEGLLLYLSSEELDDLLGNIQSLLLRYPDSVWITDFVTQQNLGELLASHPGVASAVRNVFALTGRSVISANPFASDACVEALLRKHNLVTQSTVSLKATGEALPCGRSTNGRAMHEVLGSRKIWKIAAVAN